MKQVWRLIEAERFAEAEAMCGQILTQAPTSLEAQFAFSVCMYKQGRIEAALASVEQVLSIDPNAFSVLTLASRIHFERENFESALEYSRRALAIRPTEVAVLLMIGKCLKSTGQLFEALQAFDAVVQLDSRQAPGYFGLAEVFGQIGSSYDASEALSRGLQIAESRSQLIHLAESELGIGRIRHALKAAQRVLQVDSQDVTANVIAARCFTELGDSIRADHHWVSAQQGSDSAWQIVGQKAYALSVTGQFEKADACIDESIALQPLQGSAYQLMFTIRKATEGDRELVKRLEALTEDLERDSNERAPLHFAIAKAYDDLSDPELAMVHYDRANAIRLEERRSKTPFQPQEMVDRCALLRRLFSAPFPRREGSALARPIFVVGMMRSGTSLLEQILSAHPEVVGAGELDFWPGSEGLMIDTSRQKLRPESTFERRAAYIRLLSSFGKETQRVVDKNPANLLSAGLIHHVFPDSPILYLRRDPIDTAISIWMTDASAPFMSDKKNIVTAIKLAIEQAAHWRKVIPNNRWFELDYKDLVNDPETSTRSALEFCGLAWDEACLQPGKARKSVKTPSLWQVRQGIYKSSLSRWKRYEPWLGEFRELLPLE